MKNFFFSFFDFLRLFLVLFLVLLLLSQTEYNKKKRFTIYAWARIRLLVQRTNKEHLLLYWLLMQIRSLVVVVVVVVRAANQSNTNGWGRKIIKWSYSSASSSFSLALALNWALKCSMDSSVEQPKRFSCVASCALANVSSVCGWRNSLVRTHKKHWESELKWNVCSLSWAIDAHSAPAAAAAAAIAQLSLFTQSLLSSKLNSDLILCVRADQKLYLKQIKLKAKQNARKKSKVFLFFLLPHTQKMPAEW